MSVKTFAELGWTNEQFIFQASFTKTTVMFLLSFSTLCWFCEASCQTEKANEIKTISLDGDIVLGGVFPMHICTAAHHLLRKQPPALQSCNK